MTAEQIAASLTKAQRQALAWLLGIRIAAPQSWQPVRPCSTLWRKASAHYPPFLALEEMGLVERKVIFGGTFWRLKEGDGLAVSALLKKEPTS